MDEFDKASEFEELRRKIALRTRKPAGPQATGCCLFCGEPLPPGQRWCNSDCRDDWEKIQRAQREAPVCG